MSGLFLFLTCIFGEEWYNEGDIKALEDGMTKKTRRDIAAYLQFLNTNGCPVRLSEWDVLFAPYTEDEWFPFLYGGERETAVVAIKHGQKVIVQLHILAAAEEVLILPLEYMFERLYEQCGECGSNASVVDACMRSLAYIRENYERDISVKDVAKGSGYSESYFGYYFKKVHGVSVNGYVVQLRLEKAAQLLEKTSLPITAIAQKVGFADANYFSVVFKKTYGAAPREYRNTHKPS